MQVPATAGSNARHPRSLLILRNLQSQFSTLTWYGSNGHFVTQNSSLGGVYLPETPNAATTRPASARIDMANSCLAFSFFRYSRTGGSAMFALAGSKRTYSRPSSIARFFV